jgi:uncharacterized protein YbbK (DUF523 family)
VSQEKVTVYAITHLYRSDNALDLVTLEATKHKKTYRFAAPDKATGFRTVVPHAELHESVEEAVRAHDRLIEKRLEDAREALADAEKDAAEERACLRKILLEKSGSWGWCNRR